jgi:hypothetical protein
MSTRRCSRLVIGLAALALVAVWIFSETVSSAAKADRSAPSTPTNLIVTAVADTSISLKWQPSTDNSGSLSYKVKITCLANSAFNSLATVGQNQTTYTAKFLRANSPYTFAVYAIDPSGNKSGDSNLVSASTLADTTPPTTPVLEASVLGPSQVKLIWTKSTDNSGACCSYSFTRNGSPLTENINWVVPPDGSKLAVVIRHLPPGSANSFSVTVSDSPGGNAITSNTVNVVTEPSSDVVPPTAPTNLHLVRDDSCAEVWLGWNEANDNVDSQEVIEYEIYVNGVLSPLPVSAGVDFDFVYGTNHGDNTFVVKAVDRSGNTSQGSAPIKLFLWPC